MRVERTFALDGVRSDGWFERVVSNVPALARLCEGIGEPLVALALVAGFRIVSAGLDRVTSEVTTLQWVRDGSDGTEVNDAGPPDGLRSEVMAALLGDADVLAELPDDADDATLRSFVGTRYVLLAPLFGITLRTLTVASPEDARLVVAHDGAEESVGLRQLRRFLRSRVIDVLQSQRKSTVAIDLEQTEVARVAFMAGRYDDVVGRLGGWISPLMMYLRTPEAAALEPRTRAELGQALGLLGESLDRLGRSDEGEETLRLAIQYAQDGPAAAELYRALARVLVGRGRRSESIGLIRRALTLEPAVRDLLPDLALGFIETRRAVAAIACLREMHSAGMEGARVDAVDTALRDYFGTAYDTLLGHLKPRPLPV